MKSLVGNNWVDAKSGKVIEVLNPANGKLVDTVPSLSKEEVDDLIELNNGLSDMIFIFIQSKIS